MNRLLWWTTAALIVLGWPGAGAWADDGSLDEAYRREIAFLTSELAALREQRDELAARQQREIADGRSELQQLQAQLEALEVQSEDLDRQLDDIVSAEDEAIERADMLEGTLEQARISLRDRDVDIPSEVANANAVERIFDEAIGWAGVASQVTREETSFFGEDGAEVQGTVLHVGRIASYGVADGQAGALIPVSGGGMTLSNHDTAGAARDIVEGKASGVLPVVVFDEQGNVADEEDGKTLIEFISAGGVIGWIIVSLGLVGLLLGAIRGFLLWQARTDLPALLDELRPLVEAGDLDAAAAAAGKRRGVTAKVVKATIPVLGEDTERVENVASEAILHHLPLLERFSAVLTVIAAVAPLLGLLGTVTGMISTFDVITEYGTGDPKMLSGGISEALVTTELGLIVAIPVLMMATLLGAYSQRQTSMMEKAVLHLSNVYGSTEGDGTGGAPPEPPPEKKAPPKKKAPPTPAPAEA